ncbi:MAG: hypothetical protein A2293_17070 [Elusimicrobia bacterium RIFOXYB2_FULL_49_7]|nr:MAG: hypothetical protein A2293_17070 [Elusimicrobia bacterium RIFOXYB2_FULL_49_7]
MIKILTLILTLCAISVNAATLTYIIYREGNFERDRYRVSVSTDPAEYQNFVDVGAVTIEEADRQPSRVTIMEKSYNEKYIKLTFTPKDEKEKKHFESMAERNLMRLIYRNSVIHRYDPRVGGFVIEPFSEKYGELPDDFEIKISSK